MSGLCGNSVGIVWALAGGGAGGAVGDFHVHDMENQ